MSDALKQAYASNTQTPLNTIELLHSGLTGGALRFVQAYTDITATLEDSSTVTFTAIGFGLNLPEKTTNGRQDLDIQIDGVSRQAITEIDAVISASRTTPEKLICKYRPFLESDLSAPAGATYILTIVSSSVTSDSVVLRASYSPIPDIAYPKLRYYTNIYPGLKYVQ